MTEEGYKKVGTVTHFFPNVNAAVVSFEDNLEVGNHIKIKGVRGEERVPFEVEQKVTSLERDNEPVKAAESGDELGMAVEGEVREGDEVFKATS